MLEVGLCFLVKAHIGDLMTSERTLKKLQERWKKNNAVKSPLQQAV